MNERCKRTLIYTTVNITKKKADLYLFWVYTGFLFWPGSTPLMLHFLKWAVVVCLHLVSVQKNGASELWALYVQSVLPRGDTWSIVNVMEVVLTNEKHFLPNYLHSERWQLVSKYFVVVYLLVCFLLVFFYGKKCFWGTQHIVLCVAFSGWKLGNCPRDSQNCTLTKRNWPLWLLSRLSILVL